MMNPLKKTKTTNDLEINHLEQESQYYDMIVFCHLRWQFVYQRPQHIISRMAQTLKVLLIEEPLYNKELNHTGNLIVVNDMLHVLQPNVKEIESIAGIIPHYVKNKNSAIGWFYSPSFCPLLESLDFDIIVYDCMDELSLFKGAPAHLINQEKYLIANADIIFTGGKSLYESKKQFHANVHCFPSSVDVQHFAQAQNGIAPAADISNLQSPIVGYYGVIDERIDLELLHETAKKMPDASFVMIGPLAKIEEADLPKEPNIHYLGMKSYNELPHYLKVFDIAMMPFALNDATKYISPTKTLEYMAAGKPIISTKITDVVRDYMLCVNLVETSDEFCEKITQITNDKDLFTMELQYLKILNKTSWDHTVNQMQSILKIYAK
ncbi:glycosyltransferase [Flavobacterium hungaricum]|uniref:Glycosyltransferase family 1 protein n=1 Tax=Flavobacterium hungaricum TaxID=2082725 RepID=A0ABR9TKT7_9FLAO|nr:glycosyltransferase [Flavobacterium hungaricum]MBE8725986.1 glycosyltransferase family 1 protein [Flavobacterium hungaricum]